MIGGADGIDDMDLLRHGAMDALFGGIRAPSTLGSHLRSYTWGNVRQLEAMTARCWRNWPPGRRCCPGKDVLAFVDIDSMQKRIYGTPSRAPGSGTSRSRVNRCWSAG